MRQEKTPTEAPGLVMSQSTSNSVQTVISRASLMPNRNLGDIPELDACRLIASTSLFEDALGEVTHDGLVWLHLTYYPDEASVR
jgi:hypothetical protein